LAATIDTVNNNKAIAAFSKIAMVVQSKLQKQGLGC
jgi:hypothetical protein